MSKQTDEKSWREYRREQAWVLKQQGWKQKAIAEALGVSEGAVSQWMVRGRLGELAARPVPGKAPGLNSEAHAKLRDILDAQAEANGFEGDVWTQRRVRQVIQEQFGMRYSERHVGRILRQMGYTLQTPVEQASQRNPEAIAAWQTQGWPEVKKRRTRRGIR
jgi:transposase